VGDAGLFVVALAVAVGLVGIVVPVLPGTVLIAVATAAWAVATGGAAWAVFAGVAVVLAAGQVAMYLVPGRRLTRAGIRRRTLLLGGVLGVVGFFVVPVVGLPLGFVLGVFLAELLQASRRPAVVPLPDVAVTPRSRARRLPARPEPAADPPGAAVHRAWSSTVVALKGVGLSVLIEGGAGVVASTVWVVGALVLR
jgi:uncharacterized protein YqgC (DUF456 family)